MLVSTKRPDFDTLRRKYEPLPEDAWEALDYNSQRTVLRRHFCDYSPRNLRIRNKDGDIVPFTMNDEQLYLHHIAETMLKTVGYVRLLVLKSRQVGNSTYIGGRLFHKVTQNLGKKALILAHDEPASQTLFDMVELFYNESHPELKPDADRDSAKQLRFNEQHAGYKVATAAGKGPGRADNFNYLHWSESAKTKNADEIKAGAFQCVPLRKDTEIWVESTAQGRSGTYYQMWVDSITEEDPNLGFWSVFIPWYWHEEYRMPVPKDFKLTAEESTLKHTYDLDDEQIMFRRHAMASLKPSDGGKRSDLFRQEYPSNWREAFIFSGSCVFEIEDLERAEKMCSKPKWRGSILPRDDHKGPGKLIERSDGPLKIWVGPVKGHRYVIGSDSAEGLPTGDFSAAEVIDTYDGSTVATWHGHIPPSEFGETLIALGYKYNKAQLAPETFFTDSVLSKLQEYRYPDIYQREVLDGASGNKTKRWGWRTTKNSKNTAIDALDEDLRDGVPLRDMALVNEMSAFITHDNQKRSASPGHHDDLVMARAIASAVWRSHPAYRKRVQVIVNDEDRQQAVKTQELRDRVGKIPSDFFGQKDAKKTEVKTRPRNPENGPIIGGDRRFGDSRRNKLRPRSWVKRGLG